jgi:hypothetical protein
MLFLVFILPQVVLATFREVLELSLLIRQPEWKNNLHHLRTFELFQKITSILYGNSQVFPIMRTKYLIYELLVLGNLSSEYFRDILLTRSAGAICPSTSTVINRSGIYLYSPELLLIVDSKRAFKEYSNPDKSNSYDLMGMVKEKLKGKPLKEIFVLANIQHWDEFYKFIDLAFSVEQKNKILSIESSNPMKILEERIAKYEKYLFPELSLIDHSKSYLLLMASFHLLNYFKYFFWLCIVSKDDQFTTSNKATKLYSIIKNLWISFEHIVDDLMNNIQNLEAVYAMEFPPPSKLESSFQPDELSLGNPQTESTTLMIGSSESDPTPGSSSFPVEQSNGISVLFKNKPFYLKKLKIVMIFLPSCDPFDLECSMNLTEIVDKKRIIFQGGEVGEFVVYCSNALINSQDKILENAKKTIFSSTSDKKIE